MRHDLEMGTVPILLCLVLAAFPGAAPAGDLLVFDADASQEIALGNSADRAIDHRFQPIGADRSYLRNGEDGARFDYAMWGQLSADSAPGSSASERVILHGSMQFEFDLPTALWDFAVLARYSGVLASNASNATASTSSVSLVSGGSVEGIASRAPAFSSREVSDGVISLRSLPGGGGELESRLPGPGSLSAVFSAEVTSEGGGLLVNGGEAFVTFGMASPLGSFGLNEHFRSTDGIFITLVFQPHFRMAGQTLNGDVSLASGEWIRGFGGIAGAVSSAPDAPIEASGGTLRLGRDVLPLALHGPLSVAADATASLRSSTPAELHGPVSLNGGTLLAPSGVHIGDSLSGNGRVEADLVVEGILTPGHSAGFLDIAGDLTLQPDAQLAIELAGFSAYDRLRVSGLATLGGLLEVALIDGFVLEQAQAFEIIDAAFLAGEFLGLAEGAVVGNYGGLDLFITYRGGDGNDVFLFTAAAVPEPGTYALLLAGLGLIGFAARRRISTN